MAAIFSEKAEKNFKFLGPLEVRKRVGVGGERGVFATKLIRAGQLVMKEDPIIKAPLSSTSGESMHVQLAKLAIDSKNAAVEEALSLLHPSSLADIAEEGLKKAKKMHGEAADRLNKYSGSKLTKDECLLLILKMQLNAFNGGLFLRMSMVNHSYSPNLHKFQPGGNVKGDNIGYSEARAVRTIKPGEEVTWSYFSPLLEATPNHQMSLFLHQHFTMPYQPNTKEYDISWPHPPETLLLESKSDPALSSLESSMQIKQIEDKLDSLDAALAIGKIDGNDLIQYIEAIDFVPRLGPRHIVRARIQLMIAKGCQKLLAEDDEKLRKKCSKKSKQTPKNAIIMLEMLREVEKTQKLYLPSTHITFGATLADEHEALTYLLRYDPKLLYNSFSNELGNYRQASKEELRLRKLSGEIQSLYTAQLKGVEEDVESAVDDYKRPSSVTESNSNYDSELVGAKDGKLSTEENEAWDLFD